MSRLRRMPPVERRLPALGLAVCGLLAACTMGPDYRPPEVQVPGRWQPPPVQPVRLPAATRRRRSARWNCSTPPGGPHSAIRKLDALIRVALEENKDLRIAALRVEQYNAQLQVAQSQGGPQAVARGQRTRDAVSQNRFIPVAGGAYPVGNTYEIGAGVTWEIDFWGRVRRANEAALADLMATEEDRRALVLSLVANVASDVRHPARPRSRARAASARRRQPPRVAAASRQEARRRRRRRAAVLQGEGRVRGSPGRADGEGGRDHRPRARAFVAARPQPRPDRARQDARQP